jgi:hypothetical protein
MSILKDYMLNTKNPKGERSNPVTSVALGLLCFAGTVLLNRQQELSPHLVWLCFAEERKLKQKMNTSR